MDEKVPAAEIARRSWSEGIWMYLFQDSTLQRGKKNVLVVLGPDRTDPNFAQMEKEFKAFEKELDEVHDLVVSFEDHPAGFLHEKFNLTAQQFAWYLIDIHGDRIGESSTAITVAGVLGRLKELGTSPKRLS